MRAAYLEAGEAGGGQVALGNVRGSDDSDLKATGSGGHAASGRLLAGRRDLVGDGLSHHSRRDRRQRGELEDTGRRHRERWRSVSCAQKKAAAMLKW